MNRAFGYNIRNFKGGHMAYFIQQEKDNIVVSKEIVTLFQVTSFKIRSLNDNEIRSYTFSDVGKDFYVQDGLSASGFFELQIRLFDHDIPIERVYFDADYPNMTKVTVPKTKKRVITKQEDIEMRMKLENEFYEKVKEKVEHVLG